MEDKEPIARCMYCDSSLYASPTELGWVKHSYGKGICFNCIEDLHRHMIATKGSFDNYFTCSICKKRFSGNRYTEGHNAWPVNHGRCCLECNNSVVANARREQGYYQSETTGRD